MCKKGNPHALLVGSKIGTATMTIWKVFKNLKMELNTQ